MAHKTWGSPELQTALDTGRGVLVSDKKEARGGGARVGLTALCLCVRHCLTRAQALGGGAESLQAGRVPRFGPRCISVVAARAGPWQVDGEAAKWREWERLGPLWLLSLPGPLLFLKSATQAPLGTRTLAGRAQQAHQVAPAQNRLLPPLDS